MIHLSQRPQVYSASGEITYPAIQLYDQMVVTAAGVTLTLPDPGGGLHRRKIRVTNTSDGPVTLYAHDGFVNSECAAIVPAGASVDLSVVKSGTSYYWSAQGGGAIAKVESHTPTLTWTGGPPTVSSSVMEYMLCEGTVFFWYDLDVSDGGGATAVNASLPVAPADVGAYPPCAGWATVDGTDTDALPYVDAANDTAENRLLGFLALPTLTDDKVCSIRAAGFYEAVGWGTFTGAETWATGTPAAITETARFKLLGDVCLAIAQWDSADSNGTNGFECDLPFFTPDRDGYVAGAGVWKTDVDGLHPVYENAFLDIDAAAAALADRQWETRSLTPATDGQIVSMRLASFFEVSGWSSYDIDPDYMTASFGGTITEKGYFCVYKGICFFWAYLATDDGNGCTGVELALPVGCRHGSADIALFCRALVNTASSNPCAYIPATEEAAQDRNKVLLANSPTFTDGAAGTLAVAGFYPIG